MIICFSKKVNDFDEKSLENCKNIQDYIPTMVNITSNCACPKCKSICNFSYHGSYKRNISIVNTNVNENFSVNITRVKCNSCNSTHALLPSFLVPYKIFTSESILNIITSATKTSVLKTAELLKISYELIYYYIALLIAFWSDLVILNNEKEYIHRKNFDKIYLFNNCLNFCNANFKSDFLHFFKWCFLMSKFRNTLSCKIYIGTSIFAST